MDNQALTEKWNTFSERAYIEKFSLHLKAQGFSEHTEAAHLSHLSYFLKFLNQTGERIETATVDTIRNYQLWSFYKTIYD